MMSTNLKWRYLKARSFRLICTAMTWTTLFILALLLWHVLKEGYEWIGLDFLTGKPSRFPEKAGIWPALVGTVWLISLTACFSIPVGVGAAVYLEEFASKNRLTSFINTNIANLAGVPSIVYGMLGLAFFVKTIQLDYSILAGSLTLALLILPVIIIVSQEAIRSVPSSIRLAALALGATPWQTVRSHVLPSSIPGIMTGVILAISRALGETAPIMMLGAAVYASKAPNSPMDAITALPLQIYAWATYPNNDFKSLAAAGIIILLIVLLLMNALAVFVRHYAERKKA